MAKARGKKAKVSKSRSKSKVTGKSVKKPAKKLAKKSAKKRYMRQQAEARAQQLLKASAVRSESYGIELSQKSAYIQAQAQQLAKDWPKMTVDMKREWKSERYEPAIKEIMNSAVKITSEEAQKNHDPVAYKVAKEIASMNENSAVVAQLNKSQTDFLTDKLKPIEEKGMLATEKSGGIFGIIKRAKKEHEERANKGE